MPSLEIHPLSELRGEAAALLAERFARQRATEPLLPEVDDFEPHVPAAGLVATRGGTAVAYLADEGGELRRPSFAGHAATEPEALRDLFAALAARTGADRFAVTVPASDDALIDAWFRLAFGCQFMWAVREVEPAPAVDFGGTIRRSTHDDIEAATALAVELWTLQVRAPSFGDRGLPSQEEKFAEWRETLDDPETYTHFVAERDGEVVGHVLLSRRPTGDLRVPSHNIDLSLAGTRADARGSGVGVALTNHALAWAHEHGFRSMTIDWRSVNLFSSRFWPRRGFRTTYLRLYRRVP